MNILVTALSLCNDRDLDPLVEIRGRKILFPPSLFCATVSFDDQKSCPSLCLPSPSLFLLWPHPFPLFFPLLLLHHSPPVLFIPFLSPCFPQLLSMPITNSPWPSSPTTTGLFFGIKQFPLFYQGAHRTGGGQLVLSQTPFNHNSLTVFISMIGFPAGASGKESAYQCRRCKRLGFDPWVGKIPGEGNDYPPWYACLENSMDRGSWQAIVHGAAKSRT